MSRKSHRSNRPHASSDEITDALTLFQLEHMNRKALRAQRWTRPLESKKRIRD